MMTGGETDVHFKGTTVHLGWIDGPEGQAWAAIVREDGNERVIARRTLALGGPHALELTATIEALAEIAGDAPVTVVTPSRYVPDTLGRHVPRWRANDWRRGSGGRVAHWELWADLTEAVAGRQVTWRVAERGSDPDLERANRAAAEEARRPKGTSFDDFAGRATTPLAGDDDDDDAAEYDRRKARPAR